MAVNIPNIGTNLDALMKGVSTGSDLMHKMMLNKYYSQPHASGDVANALYVEQLKAQYGENDPRYLQAKNAHDMTMRGHQSLMDYRTQLSNLAPYRAATPEEKLVAAKEGKGVLQKFAGGAVGNGAVKPGMVSGDDGHTISEEEARVYNQALGKKTTDAAIRNKIPYAENVRITMSNIVPEDLVQYSGLMGQINYLKDFSKAAIGTPPENFMAYQRALTGAKTLSKQLRQFWGDSIQPAATDKIDQLTNPSYWNKNPEVALQQFNQLRKITDQELETFKAAGTSPLKLDYDRKTDSFLVGDKQKAAESEQGLQSAHTRKKDDELLQSYKDKLLEIDPEYTAENIRHTAEAEGKNVGQVITELMSGV